MSFQKCIVIWKNQVNPERAKYFSEITNLFEIQGADVDELATNYIISHYLQTLLGGCNLDDLCGFLRGCANVFPAIAMDRSGSHVAESALKSLAWHVEDTDAYSVIEDTLKMICEADIMCFKSKRFVGAFHRTVFGLATVHLSTCSFDKKFGDWIVTQQRNQQPLTDRSLAHTRCFLVTVFLLGLIGSLFKNSFFMFVYLGIMFLSILCLIGFTVCVFLITNSDAGKVFSDKDLFIQESKTLHFSHWLQNHFVNDN